MISAAFSPILLVLIVAISILLMLIRPRNIPEVYWVGGGATPVDRLAVDPTQIGRKGRGRRLRRLSLSHRHDAAVGISSQARRLRLAFLRRSEGAHGSCTRLFTLVYGVGTLVTIFMSNDATAVVLTPAILAVMRKAKVAPLPYLFACAMIANAASFVLPISNPANLVVFHASIPPLGRWLSSFGLPSILSIATTYLVLRFVFRKNLQAAQKKAIAQNLFPRTAGLY